MAQNSKQFNHERNPENTKDEWLTPPPILQALGPFDLDPCAPVNRPWDMAKTYYTIMEDGLLRSWFGRKWVNPPYGARAEPFMRRLAHEGNGIALLFARTETRLFFDYVWAYATSLLFLEGRLTFFNVDGTPATDKEGRPSPAGAPSVLIGYGPENDEARRCSNLKGIYIPRWDWLRLPEPKQYSFF
ncbi:MAG: adenine methyltransferase [Anaerolineales bacterium]|nr:adenine methyltransferase [Anaerolineales bacterium]